LVLGAGGCLTDLEPQVGALLQSPCADEDSDPGAAVGFGADILDALLAQPVGGCMSCHDPSQGSPLGFTVGGLDLSSYAGLRRGGAQGGSDVVVPEQPCSSVLVLKLGPAPPFGSRMPLNGPPFLSPAEQQRVRDWIAEGAHE